MVSMLYITCQELAIDFFFPMDENFTKLKVKGIEKNYIVQ